MVVTRNDVARAAGVSSAVVSYVLNDGPRPVSESARERVLTAIDELGYRRNSIARSMRTRKTNSIGFVLPEIVWSYFSVMTQRITDIARAKGLSVIVATSNGDVDVEREHLVELAGRQVDGVILMSVDPTRDLKWTESLGIPILLVDRPRVAIESAASATRHLLENGCVRLARIGAPIDEPLGRRRDAGWHEALRAHGVDPAAALLVRAGHTEDAGYAAALEILSTSPLPDGVVIDTPPHATAFLRAAADRGVRVPDDIAVIACEFGASAEYTIPRLSSVDSPLEDVAAQAVAAIIAAEQGASLLTLDGDDFVVHIRESSLRPQK